MPEQLWQEEDKNGDGFLSGDELYDILNPLVASLSRRDVMQMMKMADLDDDNAIKYEEFSALFATEQKDTGTAISGSSPAVGSGSGDPVLQPRRDEHLHMLSAL